MSYYRFTRIRELIVEGKIAYATNDAVTDAAELDIEDRLPELLRLLQGDDFSNEVPGNTTLFGTLDADSYSLWCDLESLTRVGPKKGAKLYIKIAICQMPSVQHESCLVISIHPDKYYVG